ncbi:non-heme iron oxygenase ferredoxin subunit [Mariprofundus ferrooxydans]|uniref:Rieske 2Fe-2S family protein n=1 Tax=Mariprofundus ferrooxydans PV-1 TaxID=314345 RepID=Q0F1C6_9PROT|nr:non-heme iron oxygenase ferredoxin subunit [Mariprofundus ferrooxydans]EAU55265.1 Rieske 2Fe-2S family protein [Mariprofundus ferrooxydans PV-1]KON47210.1 ferredoxin [Mariprofundus ferrooxydans]
MAEWMDVGEIGELPPGSRKIFNTPYCEIAVFNLAGEFFAIEDVCSHDGGELASGVCEGDQIICPRHGARFCIRNGRALTPPAYEDISTFPVRIENGMVQIDIDD